LRLLRQGHFSIFLLRSIMEGSPGVTPGCADLESALILPIDPPYPVIFSSARKWPPPAWWPLRSAMDRE
jgi:hypothetical protein